MQRREFLGTTLGLAGAACAPGLLLGQQQLAQDQIINQAQGRGKPPEVPDPVPFTSKDGKIKGWKLTIPGSRPLATPAVVEGKLYVGGGFGSHEFYAFDAKSGKKVWVYQTGDDGPTAAVISDGCIAFNTESCELELLSLDGKAMWKKWLGDPLMSMPAIADGKVYMCYPHSKGDRQHYLACFELKTGKELWKQAIAGEIITAPTITNGHVYLSCLEGTVYCFKTKAGELAWKEKKNATSSPIVWKDGCYFSRREEVVIKKDGKEIKQQREQLSLRPDDPKAATKDFKATLRDADYLDNVKTSASPLGKAQAVQDGTVGFGGAKGDAKIGQAEMNLGRGTVCGVWAFQGSKPFIYQDLLFSAMGDTLKCVDPKTEKVLWEKPLGKKKDEKDALDGLLTPPALVNGKAFLGSSNGEVLCVSTKTGEVIWRCEVGEPILFQPAVVDGRVYIATNSGSLLGLETGDAKDDGWRMWGANAAHDGKAE